MKRIIIFILILSSTCYAQDALRQYAGKTFIFQFYEQIKESDIGGNASGDYITALKGSLFTVQHIMANGDLVITFNTWKVPNSYKYIKNTDKRNIALNKRQIFNFKVDPLKASAENPAPTDNIKFFLLEKNKFNTSCIEYTTVKSWDITFGTITTPFKFRSNPFLFATNLNLGTSICYQRKFYTNFSWGVIGGLSLSSVTLDSFSTKGFVTTNTERPAVTPSLHGMIGYKNINLTFGIGWDFINKSTSVESSWIYHGKRWFGIGLGVSLFNSNNTNPTVKKDDDQKN